MKYRRDVKMAGLNKRKDTRFHTEIVCATCGIKCWVANSEIRKGGGKYCSKDCYRKSYIGKQSRHWKGGRKINKYGYVEIYKPESKMACSMGYVKEHRYVMSQYLGRDLTPDELVHHIDGIKTNNNIENLEIMTKGIHGCIHHKGSIFSDTHRMRISESKKRINYQHNDDGTFKKGVKYAA